MANEDEIKGKFENLKGRAKEAFGAVTGDKGKQAEGLGERVKGAIREKFGQAKRESEPPPEDRPPKAEDEDEDL